MKIREQFSTTQVGTCEYKLLYFLLSAFTIFPSYYGTSWHWIFNSRHIWAMLWNRTAVVQRWLTLLKWDHNVIIILTLNVQMTTINNQPHLINLFLQQDNNDIIDQWFLNAFFPNMTPPNFFSIYVFKKMWWRVKTGTCGEGLLCWWHALLVKSSINCIQIKWLLGSWRKCYLSAV